MELPTAEEVTDKRIAAFKRRITETLDTAELDLFRKLVEDYQHEYGVPVLDIAAALGALAQGKKPLAAKSKEKAPKKREEGAAPRERGDRKERPARDKPPRAKADREGPAPGMERFRLEVGHAHGVKPANIVGAIANEAEIESEYIGRIDIHEDHSTVELPEGMPKEIFKHLKSVWVSGQRLQISRLEAADKKGARPHSRKPPGKRRGGPRHRSPK